MYCSHCGKKLGDSMLFCPFCGEAIVIPEQDDGSDAAPAPEGQNPGAAPEQRAEEALPEAIPVAAEAATEAASAAEELEAWSRERSRSEDDAPWMRPEEEFTPLKLDAEEETPRKDWREEIAKRKQAADPAEKKAPEIRHAEEEPVRLEGSAPKLELDVKGAKPRKSQRKHANTLVPPKTMNPNDIFMDGKVPERADDDPYDAPAREDFSADFSFEDEDEGSFFMRHLRGIVGLALFVILILLFVIYGFSKAGQLSLARFNLAWSTDAYSQLGYQSYQEEQYVQAGQYYERALQRAPDNYSFASSAAMAYYGAGNTEKTAELLKKCIAIDPARSEAYLFLLSLYPEGAARPWDVTQLLQQGYQMTGDSRLKVGG